jgi:uncharacterized protein DUF4397
LKRLGCGYALHALCEHEIHQQFMEVAMKKRTVMRALFATLVTALVAAGGAAAGAAEAQSSGVVTVVHGLRGLVGDVYLDGKLVLAGFEPERSTDPLTVPAGAHQVDIRPAGALATASPALSGTITVQPGSQQSAVAHLSDTGQPTLTVFADDTAPVPPGKARVVARHTAAAGPVDISLSGQPFLSALAFRSQQVTTIDPGRHTVAVTSGGVAVFPSNEVVYAEGSTTWMYLIGSLAQRNLTWISRSVPGIAVLPVVVRSGNSGLADPADFPVLEIAVLALIVVGSVWKLRRPLAA